jgi:hypothetical protein
VFFSLAVSLIPMVPPCIDTVVAASVQAPAPSCRAWCACFSLILLIEVASLMGNYY